MHKHGFVFFSAIQLESRNHESSGFKKVPSREKELFFAGFRKIQWIFLLPNTILDSRIQDRDEIQQKTVNPVEKGSYRTQPKHIWDLGIWEYLERGL